MILHYRFEENTSQIGCPRFHSRFLEKVENIKCFFKSNIKTHLERKKYPILLIYNSGNPEHFRKMTFLDIVWL